MHDVPEMYDELWSRVHGGDFPKDSTSARIGKLIRCEWRGRTVLRFIDMGIGYHREGKQWRVAALLRALQFQSCILDRRLPVRTRDIMRPWGSCIEFTVGDLEALTEAVIASQRMQLFQHDANTIGQGPDWEFHPP